MKYILITLDNNVQKEFKSLLQMSKDLNTTYCSVYNNFLLHVSTFDINMLLAFKSLCLNDGYLQ